MRRLVPISAFIVPFGVAFGVAATERGLAPVEATVMSALVFTATAQFAALDMLAAPVPFVSLALIVLTLSSRHIVMGATLARWVNGLPLPQRLATLALLSDANFADTQSRVHRGDTDIGGLFGGGLILWLAWVASTAFGAFGGTLLADPEALGVAAVLPCFFAATVVVMLRRSRRLALPAIAAVTVSASTAALLPMGWNIIAAALVGGVVGVLFDNE